MPRFLDTRGNSSLAIAICDRCKTKFPIGKLSADGDAPGLRVCEECNDEADPYKLPSRRTESITVRYPRPDEPIRPSGAPAPAPPPPPPILGFHDAFDGAADTILSDHTPDLAAVGFLWADDGATPMPVLDGLGSMVAVTPTASDESIALGPIYLDAAGYTATLITTCTLISDVAEGAGYCTISNADFSVSITFALFAQATGLLQPASVRVFGVDGTLTPFNEVIPIADIAIDEPHEVKIVITAVGCEVYYDTVLLATFPFPGLNFIVGQVLVLISVNTGVGTNSQFSIQDLLIETPSP